MAPLTLNGAFLPTAGPLVSLNQQKVTEMYSRLVYKKMAAISARDNSFTEQPTFIERLLGLHKISREEVRQIYLRGIQTGLEEGIRMVRLEGQDDDAERKRQDPTAERVFTEVP